MTQKHLTFRDVMKRYGVSQGTLYNWLRQGLFPRGFYVGRTHRWTLGEIEEFENNKTQEGDTIA